ncbi:MAG TPA: DUF1127 domain-containing protein [Albidovulum sp.]|uniref:DUF1127 domain-containing protein n=1 Tax=Albidovulum sp. TaxID=1872424 RepID=UPI002BC4B057|nr:DUF1127 domain-containing protein [Albidovulum sp.]
MTILAGKNWIERLINRYRARQALGAELLRQDDRMLEDIGLTRSDLTREIGTWQERAERAAAPFRRTLAPISPAPSAGGLASLSLPMAAIREALLLRRAA